MENGRRSWTDKQKKSEDLPSESRHESLDIIYTNAQSVVNKIDELRSVANDLKPDIILINESWTNSNITKAYLNIDGYELTARSDRVDTSDGRGGGLIIYNKVGLAISELDSKSTFNQHLSMSVATESKPFVVNLVYRSPNSSPMNNVKLNEFMQTINASSLTIGDFNYRGIDWENGSSDSEGREFFNCTQDAFLTQHVDFPTHEGHTIDLVLSTNDILVTSVEDAGNLGKSHHSILHVKVVAKPAQMASTEQVPDYAKADFDKLKDCLASVNWEQEMTLLGAQDSWDFFKKHLSKAIEECIPLKARRVANRPLWMNRNIMRLIRKKRRMWNWYKTTKDHAEYRAYQHVQKSVVKTIRIAKRNLERKLARNFKKNPRPFYSHLNKYTKSRAHVGPLKNEKDELISDNDGMCNVLNSFFSSVFTKEDTHNIPVPEQICHGNSVSSLTINETMVKKKIANLKLKLNSAPGPDKFHPRVLFELQDEISLPLHLIFNKSLLTGEVPQDWKLANVTPVFKKGSHSIAENYRPISLTSVICKILESLICETVVAHLTNQKLLRSSQHGFVSHRSCLTNLLEYLETLTALLDKGHNVDVFYLDLSKAFDRVPHQRLLAKLTAHGITGNIYNWIQSWLADRMQRVVLNGTQSKWSNVSSGVPQGSVLGPLLFIIFINDIDSAVDTLHCTLLKFADDTKGTHIVNSDDDADKLQRDLDNLFKWSSDWQMLFNLDKCHILHCGKTNPHHQYYINGHPLLAVEEEKDLGVLITSSCHPSKQVSAAALKGNQVLGQLMRAFTYRDRHTFIKLYKQYVRPHLEYCVQSWSPWLQHDIDLLENVQRRAVKAVSGLSGTYKQKLESLDLLSLQDRRQRGDMIETFKIVKQIDNVDPSYFFSLSVDNHNYATRQATIMDNSTLVSSLGLVKGHSRLELRANSFSQRVVNPWNALPAIVKNSAHVNSFKINYDAM